MNYQADLFDLSRDPARVCGVCGTDLRVDRRGVLRHKAGEGKCCDEILRVNTERMKTARRKASAHFSTETGATG
jgi:hypothetical protein